MTETRRVGTIEALVVTEAARMVDDPRVAWKQKHLKRMLPALRIDGVIFVLSKHQAQGICAELKKAVAKTVAG